MKRNHDIHTKNEKKRRREGKSKGNSNTKNCREKETRNEETKKNRAQERSP